MTKLTNEVLNKVIEFPGGKIDNKFVEAAVGVGLLAVVGGVLFTGFKYLTNSHVRKDINDVMKNRQKGETE
ncbi:hypothetical protein [Pseudescherichia sp.]|uniref:hypothetical protein n=1 Tax=Pseudescherichia sp. TaxID=2055881 RepID=UPI0028A18A87|nr:hypothetical protein [Pseudescherichia sp.]WPO96901.1 hypothetical protein SFA32_08135 [Buttiauxella sp. HR94]